jgi:antitoxin component of MazEF toxin-antitoxin module
MRVRLVRLGRSHAIRIPKAVIDAMELEGPLDLEVRSDRLVLSRAQRPREGWDAACARMARRGDDRLVHGEQLRASR